MGDSSGNLTLSANVTAVQTRVVNKVIFKCYSAWPRKIEIMTFTKKSEARLDIRPTSLEVIGFMVKSVSLKKGMMRRVSETLSVGREKDGGTFRE